jgi:hypothetical protein
MGRSPRRGVEESAVSEDRERAEPEDETIADTVVGHALVTVPDDLVEGHRLQEGAAVHAAVERPGDQ